MRKSKYDDEFKLEVINSYLEGPHSVRKIAHLYGLPSKNYIERWMTELKGKGLIPEKAHKTKTNNLKAGEGKKSAREIQLEKEVLRLQAENDFLKKLQELERRGSLKK